MAVEDARNREQAAHDEARECLARMRGRTLAAREAAAAATEVDSAIVEWTLRHRMKSLADDPAGVFFGSMDDGADELYIGRRHIERRDGEPFVIDWRVPAATPFYRATWADPMELIRRRRHTIEDHQVVAVFDEDFDDESDAVGGGGVPDPLLAELERARGGSMRDIVATIQAEQDEVIRAPLQGTIVVQGGPGTGKTAVGLHRAAFLLYDHRELLDREGVLVVGPNQRFLRYIGQVLPSLGEHAVTQLTVEGVASTRRFAKGVDSDDVATVKGSAAMITVMSNLVTDAIAPAAVEVPLGHRVIRLSSEEIRSLIEETLTSGAQVNTARDGFVQRALGAALRRRHERHPEEISQRDELTKSLRQSQGWNRAVDRIWPRQSAPALLRKLYRSKAARAALTDGVLPPEDAESLARRATKKLTDEQWSTADLILLDELEHRLNGTPKSYGHVVVDEAQDLSAMGLRMIRRRAGHDSMTVLGDLAQSTKPGGQHSWDDALEHLSPADGGRLIELEVGYRLPATILEYASQLLSTAAPTVRPSRSVREGGQPPTVTEVSADGLFDMATSMLETLAQAFTTVAVLGPPDLIPDLTHHLRDAGLDVAGEEPNVVVLEASVAKGLEFDAVLVVEPLGIVMAHKHRLRVLYVALTRAVRQLHLLHSQGLPPELVPLTS